MSEAALACTYIQGAVVLQMHKLQPMISSDSEDLQLEWLYGAAQLTTMAQHFRRALKLQFAPHSACRLARVHRRASQRTGPGVDVCRGRRTFGSEQRDRISHDRWRNDRPRRHHLSQRHTFRHLRQNDGLDDERDRPQASWPPSPLRHIECRPGFTGR